MNRCRKMKIFCTKMCSKDYFLYQSMQNFCKCFKYSLLNIDNRLMSCFLTHMSHFVFAYVFVIC